jgi:Protein of unknown function (DUF3592)
MPLWVRLVVAGLGILFVTGSVAWFVWASSRVAEARDWPRAPGRVVATRIERERSETRETDSRRRDQLRVSYTYRPVVAYTYRVGGRAFAADTIWLTSAVSWSDPADARAFLADYPVGAPISPFYDPADPSDAALIIEPPTPLVFIATAIGLILLAFAWFFPADRPGRPVLPEGAARALLRNRRRG